MSEAASRATSYAEVVRAALTTRPHSHTRPWLDAMTALDALERRVVQLTEALEEMVREFDPITPYGGHGRTSPSRQRRALVDARVALAAFEEGK